MSLLPQLNYEIDINEPLKCTEFTAVQGSDFQIVIRVKRYGVLQTLENVTPSLKVANSGETWIRTFTGTAGGANDESIIIPVDGDTLDSNGEMDYDIVLTDGDSNNIVHRRGKFLIYEDVPGGATPPAGNPIDWSAFLGYSNTATDGPYTAGTGIAFGTADGDGKVPINATATSAEWGNITGTLSDQTDLQAELDDRLKLSGTDQTVQGVIRTSGGSAMGTTCRGQTAVSVGPSGDIAGQFRDGATDSLVVESLRDGANLVIRSQVAGNTSGDLHLNDLAGGVYSSDTLPHADATHTLGTSSLKWLAGYISTLYSGAIQALTSAGLTLKSSNGTTCLTAGAGGGANVSTADGLTVGGSLTVTNKQASAYVNTDKRVATMTGDETLTATSAMLQFLDPADADRNVDLPNGTQFTIQNTGDGGETITVRDASDVTIDTIENGTTLTFVDATGSGGWEVLT